MRNHVNNKDMKKKRVKPFLKWAGGKTQLLEELLIAMPDQYNTYIEPFIGGGAFFFALRPEKAIISDSNPELINCYKQIAENVEKVIGLLERYENTGEMFYEVRKQDWTKLDPAEAAARMIYLNKTCYNGLYRVNKKGEFNSPYGRYKKPTICDANGLREASQVLQKATIICDDYKEVLDKYANKGDFVYLDPPYVPISENADFKRYTKEQFSEANQRELAGLIVLLKQRGVSMVLTNSNSGLVSELYNGYPLKVVKTKRYISSKGENRSGEDVIVTIEPDQHFCVPHQQILKYPPTRFMGSKSKLLDCIWDQVSRFQVESVVDLFAGSGIVGYMFKAHGLKVMSNDFMHMSYIFSKALIENNDVILTNDEMIELMVKKKETDRFVSNTFRGLYYTDEDNEFIDVLRSNILDISDPTKKAIAMAALIRACIKKRPRGLFTYTGIGKYDDGRRDLQISFREQFTENIEAINNAVFDNGKKNIAVCGDAMELKANADLVYFDPPYYSEFSDNDYIRRYHFVEGLARNWKGVEIQQDTKTKKFKKYDTPFSSRDGAYHAFDALFKRHEKSVLIISYSSNSLPSQDEMVHLVSKYKKNIDVLPIDYTYSFGNQKNAKTHRNKAQEYLFVGYDDSQRK